MACPAICVEIEVPEPTARPPVGGGARLGVDPTWREWAGRVVKLSTEPRAVPWALIAKARKKYFLPGFNSVARAWKFFEPLASKRVTFLRPGFGLGLAERRKPRSVMRAPPLSTSDPRKVAESVEVFFASRVSTMGWKRSPAGVPGWVVLSSGLVVLESPDPGWGLWPDQS